MFCHEVSNQYCRAVGLYKEKYFINVQIPLTNRQEILFYKGRFGRRSIGRAAYLVDLDSLRNDSSVRQGKTNVGHVG